MKWDSTLTYLEKEGFRCGTGDEFSVFNILTRKKLNLKERLLVIMEGTLQNLNYRDLSPAEALNVFKYYCKITKKYKSKFTILWHNSSFDEEGGWLGWKEIYNEIVGF